MEHDRLTAIQKHIETLEKLTTVGSTQAVAAWERAQPPFQTGAVLMGRFFDQVCGAPFRLFLHRSFSKQTRWESESLYQAAAGAGTLYGSPVASTAQAMRASLFASPTVTTFGCARDSRLDIHCVSR